MSFLHVIHFLFILAFYIPVVEELVGTTHELDENHTLTFERAESSIVPKKWDEEQVRINFEYIPL